MKRYELVVTNCDTDTQNLCGFRTTCKTPSRRYRDWENRWTSNEIGLDALYLVATMPEESRTEPHTIPSTGESIFEIGKRMLKVREEKMAEVKGGWDKWCTEDLGMTRRHANRFIKVFEEFGTSGTTSSQMGMNVLYEIATMPEESRTEAHTIPSTGAEKMVDEMTVREFFMQLILSA